MDLAPDNKVLIAKVPTSEAAFRTLEEVRPMRPCLFDWLARKWKESALSMLVVAYIELKGVFKCYRITQDLAGCIHISSSSSSCLVWALKDNNICVPVPQQPYCRHTCVLGSIPPTKTTNNNVASMVQSVSLTFLLFASVPKCVSEDIAKEQHLVLNLSGQVNSGATEQTKRSKTRLTTIATNNIVASKVQSVLLLLHASVPNSLCTSNNFCIEHSSQVNSGTTEPTKRSAHTSLPLLLASLNCCSDRW